MRVPAQVACSGGTDVLVGDQVCAGIEGGSFGPCRVFSGYRISRFGVVTPCRPDRVLTGGVALPTLTCSWPGQLA